MRRTSQEDRELIALGRAIRSLRIERRLSAGELVAASGLSRRRIDALEAGRSDPRLDVLYALARGLGVRACELVGRAEAEEGGGHATARARARRASR